MSTNRHSTPRQLRLPLILQEMLASEDAEVVAVAEQIADLPSPDPLCPFCVVLHALEWPEYATLKLCAEHLPVARAMQCKGWNQSQWHQRLAGLARHRRLPEHVVWWPQTTEEWFAAIATIEGRHDADASMKGDA
jgi:hypothetical protein